MVRLKVDLYEVNVECLTGFNSKMVRLKAEIKVGMTVVTSGFQFQNGAIKSRSQLYKNSLIFRGFKITTTKN